MARMTLQDHIDSMRHALPRTSDPRIDIYKIFNQAGRAMISCAQRDPWYHTWSWTTEVAINVTIKAGEDYIELAWPISMGQLIRGDFEGSTVDRVVLTSPDHIAVLRSTNTSRPNVIFLAAGARGRKPNADTGPVERIAIWPRQDSDRSDLLLTFHTRWEDMDSTDPEAVPDIPDDYERLLDLVACAFWVQKCTQRPAFESAELIDEIERLVGLDSGKQVDQGEPLHSMRRRASGHVTRWFSRIDKP